MAQKRTCIVGLRMARNIKMFHCPTGLLSLGVPTQERCRCAPRSRPRDERNPRRRSPVEVCRQVRNRSFPTRVGDVSSVYPSALDHRAQEVFSCLANSGGKDVAYMASVVPVQLSTPPLMERQRRLAHRHSVVPGAHDEPTMSRS
jgi:hypothetical protein